MIANAKQSTSNTSLKKLNAELSLHLRGANEQFEEAKKKGGNRSGEHALLDTIERKRKGGAETKLENSNSNFGVKGALNRVQSTYGMPTH